MRDRIGLLRKECGRLFARMFFFFRLTKDFSLLLLLVVQGNCYRRLRTISRYMCSGGGQIDAVSSDVRSSCGQGTGLFLSSLAAFLDIYFVVLLTCWGFTKHGPVKCWYGYILSEKRNKTFDQLTRF